MQIPNLRNSDISNRVRPWLTILAIVLGGVSTIVLCAWQFGRHGATAATRDHDQVTVLNQLRDAINANYGYDKNGTPRINCGPCARFAIAFRSQWNARFREQIGVVLVMSPDRSSCGHVVLKLPDGSYFDGGNGVMSGRALFMMFSDSPIEPMVEFDLKRLSELVGGLDHDYPQCPNYSDNLTAKIIESHLALLARENDGKSESTIRSESRNSLRAVTSVAATMERQDD